MILESITLCRSNIGKWATLCSLRMTDWLHYSLSCTLFDCYINNKMIVLLTLRCIVEWAHTIWEEAGLTPINNTRMLKCSDNRRDLTSHNYKFHIILYGMIEIVRERYKFVFLCTSCTSLHYYLHHVRPTLCRQQPHRNTVATCQWTHEPPNHQPPTSRGRMSSAKLMTVNFDWHIRIVVIKVTQLFDEQQSCWSAVLLRCLIAPISDPMRISQGSVISERSVADKVRQITMVRALENLGKLITSEARFFLYLGS